VNPPGRQALSEGTLGIALLHIERGDLGTAEQLLAEAAAGGVSTGANASLFHGAPALEFVLRCAGRANARLQDAVDDVIAARLHAARERRASARLPALAEYDLIRGLTGLGALLLTRTSPAPLISDVLLYLVSLAQPSGSELPGWWSSDSPGHQQIAGGYGDNGVAHGVAGPLALLAIAARRGFQVDGQAGAIEVFTRWLDSYGSFYWITRRQLSARVLPPPRRARPSWCYKLTELNHEFSQFRGVLLV
jgi:lantibiotic biosynthesis protein